MWTHTTTLEHEEVVVELARSVEIETAAAGETICRAELGEALGVYSGAQTGFCAVQCLATVLPSSTRQVALELHVDDTYGAASPCGRKQFLKDLSRQIEFKGGDGCEWRKPYEHLKRLRTPMEEEIPLHPNTMHRDRLLEFRRTEQRWTQHPL